MKTQVIQLDTHDDLTSVRDRMSWAKTERIILVFPHRSHILARTLDLRLLLRHAGNLGAQLAIVSRLEDIRISAVGLNISAFKTIASAHRQPWEKGKLPTRPLDSIVRPDLRHMRQMRQDAIPVEAPWRSLYRFRLIFFSLGVLAILAIFSLFIPSATVGLTPATRLQSLTFTISASSDVKTINLAGSLPARLTSLVIENSKTIETTGSTTIPDERALGLVHFRNLTTEQISIPAGTIVSTQTSPLIRFATTVAAVISAGIDKTVEVPILAVEAGSISNLPADTLIAMEGFLGTSLAVTNSKPVTGGSNRTAAIQTAKDRSLVHVALLAEILNECETNLTQTHKTGDVYFPDTLKVSQILSETYFPAESQSGDTLSLTMVVRCQARYASLEDINTLALMSLNANLSEGYTPTSDVLALQPASIPFTDTDGVTRWDIHVQRLLRAKLDHMLAVQLTLGRTPSGAELRLNESLPLAELPIIQIKPDWWPWMPIIPFRITVSSGS